MNVKCIFTGKSYNLDDVAFALKKSGLDTTDAYGEEKSLFMDMTQSCDSGEALHFLIGHARRTVELSIGLMDMKRRAEFLAAYDLAKSLDSRAFM